MTTDTIKFLIDWRVCVTGYQLIYCLLIFSPESSEFFFLNKLNVLLILMLNFNLLVITDSLTFVIRALLWPRFHFSFFIVI